MEPVICGCGGKTKISFTIRNYEKEVSSSYYLSCEKCGIMISGDSAEEAIEKWNLAMSGNRVRLHNVVFAEDKPKVAPFHDKNPKRWRCGNCASSVKKVWKYCQCCGCRIDWKNKKESENDTGN